MIIINFTAAQHHTGKLLPFFLKLNMSQLPADCLNEIFEHLKDDKVTLCSCLLVNRLWCEISVRILWRSIWNYCTMNFSTLIACLPNESKGILDKNGIIISTPTSKLPMFD